MLYPVMPVFLKSIGFSIFLIGLLEGLAECLAGLTKGYFGNLSDKLAVRTPFIRIGYALSAISKPLLAAFVYPLWIFFARALDRIGKGVRTSARDALLSSETTPENKGKVFGFHRGMDTAGAALGPIAALIFLFYFPGHYRWLFIIAFVPGVIAVSLTFLLKEKIIEVKNNPVKVGFFAYFKYWNRSNSKYRFLVAGLLIFAFFNSSDVFLLLAIKNKGFSDIQMISFYIFYNLLYALLSYPMGIFADKIGMKKVLIFGLIFFAAVYFGFGFANFVWHFAILFLLYAVYAASSEGVSKAWITNICNKEDTATAIGFYNSLASIMALLASIVGGLIWSFFGPAYMFVFSGLGTILVISYIFIFRSKLA
jgi:MFS family permease